MEIWSSEKILFATHNNSQPFLLQMELSNQLMDSHHNILAAPLLLVTGWQGLQTYLSWR